MNFLLRPVSYAIMRASCLNLGSVEWTKYNRSWFSTRSPNSTLGKFNLCALVWTTKKEKKRGKEAREVHHEIFKVLSTACARDRSIYILCVLFSLSLSLLEVKKFQVKYFIHEY